MRRVVQMVERGELIIISLRENTGDTDSDLWFSFLGLHEWDLDCDFDWAQGVLGRTVLPDPAEILSVKALRFTEDSRPR